MISCHLVIFALHRTVLYSLDYALRDVRSPHPHALLRRAVMAGVLFLCVNC